MKITYGQHSEATLVKIAEQLELLAADMRVAAKELKKGGIDEVLLPFQDSLTDGMTFVTKFTGNARIAIQKRLGENGTFGSVPEGVANGSTTKTPKARGKKGPQ